MKIFLAILAAVASAQSVSVRGPELQMSGSTISHTKTDGNCHVPKSFNQPAGYQLTTNGGSCDLFWSAPGGAFVDSARVAHRADSTAFATRSDSARASHIADTAKRAGWADSSRVSNLSDSAKALVRYARITTLSDSLRVERAFDTTTSRAIVHDTSVVLRALIAARGTVSSVGLSMPGGFTVSGSPITSSGTISVSLNSQYSNYFLASPVGAPGVPGFRTISPVDLPFLIDSIAAARAYALARIHDTSLVLRQRIADTSAALRLALTDPAEVRVIVHDTSLVLRQRIADSTAAIRAAIPTGGPWLPLVAGSGSPLTGDLYGTRAVLTTTADAPISIVHNLAGGFTHPFQAFNSGMVAGNQYNFDFGQSASTNNAGNFGFKYVGAGSSSNYVTLGMYGANDLMTITAAGVPKFSGLATAGFVRANASGQLSSSPLVAGDIPSLDASKIVSGTLAASLLPNVGTMGTYSLVTTDGTGRVVSGASVNDVGHGGTGQSGFSYNFALPYCPTPSSFSSVAPNTTTSRKFLGMTGTGSAGAAPVWASIGYSDLTGSVPTWNQSTTGSAATATEAVNSTNLGGKNWDYFVQGNGAGVLGHRTTNIATTTIPATQSGFYDYLNATDGPQGAVWTHMIRSAHTGNATTNQWMFDIAAAFGPGTNGGVEGYYVRTTSAGSTPGWRQLWHSGNLTNLSQLTNGPGYITSAGSISGNAATATDAVNSTNLGGKNWDYFVQGNGAGVLGHRTTNLGSVSTIPATQSGFADVTAGDGPQGAVLSHLIRNMHQGGATSNWWSLDIAAPFAGTSGGTEAYYVRLVSNGSTPGWRQLWHSGNLTSSTLPGGPYLPLAGGTVTGPAYFNNLILNSYISTGTGSLVRLGGTGDIITLGTGINWSSPIIKFTGSTTGAAFRFDGPIQSNYGADFTSGGSTHGVAKQVAARVYSASSTLPALGLNEWCWVIHDSYQSGPNYWSVPSGYTVQFYAGGTTITSVVGGNNVAVSANQKAWTLYGPTYSGSTVMTLRM